MSPKQCARKRQTQFFFSSFVNHFALSLSLSFLRFEDNQLSIGMSGESPPPTARELLRAVVESGRRSFASSDRSAPAATSSVAAQSGQTTKVVSLNSSNAGDELQHQRQQRSTGEVISSSSSLVSMLQAKISVLEQDLDHKRRNIERTENENISLIREVSNLRIREESLKRQHKIEMEQAVKRATEDAAAAAASRLDRTIWSNSTQQQVRDELANKELEITELRSLLQQQQQNRGYSSPRSPGEASYHVLEGRLQAMQSLLDARAIDLEREADRYFQSQKRCDGLLEQVRQLQKELEMKEKVIGQLQVATASAQNELTSLKSVRQRSRRNGGSMTDLDVSPPERVLGEGEEDERWTEHQRIVTDLHQKLRDTRLELDAALGDKQHAEIVASEQKERAIKCFDELSHITNRFTEATRQVEQLRAQLEAAEQREGAAFAESSDSVIQIQRLKAQTSTLSAQLEQVERDSSDKDDTIRKLELAAMKHQPLEEVVETQRKALERGAQAIATSEQRVEDIQNQLRQSETRVKELQHVQSRLADAQRESQQLQDAVAELRQQLAEASRARDRAETFADEQKMQLQRATHEREMILADTKSLADEMFALEKQAAMSSIHERRLLELDAALQEKHNEVKALTIAYEELRQHATNLQAVVDDMGQLENAMRNQIDEKRSMLQKIEVLEEALAAEREANASHRQTTDQAKQDAATFQRAADRMAPLESMIAKLEEELSSTRSELREKERMLEKSKSHGHLVEIELDRERVKIKEMEHETSKLNSQLFEHVEKIATLERVLEQSQVQLGRVEVHADTALKHHHKLKTDVDGANKRVLELQGELETLHTELSAQQAKEAGLQEQLGDLERQKNHFAALADEKEHRCSELRSLYSATSSKLIEIEEQLVAHSKRVASLAMLEGKVSALTDLVEKKEQQRVALEAEVEKAQQVASAHERAVNNARHLDALIVQLRDALRRQESEMDESIKKHRDTARTLSEKEQEVSSEQKENRRLREALQNEQKHREILNVEVQRYEKMTKNIATLEGKLSGLSNAYSSAQLEVVALTKELDLTKTSLRQAQQALATAAHQESEVKVLKQTIAGKEESIKLLEEELERKVQQFQRLLQDLAAKEQEVKTSEGEGQRLAEASHRLSDTVDVLSKKAEDLSRSLSDEKHARQADVLRLQAKTNELQDAFNMSESSRSHVAEKLARTEDEVSRLRGECSRYEAEIGSKTVNMSIASVAIDEHKAACHAAHQALLQERQQVQRLTTELLELKEKSRLSRQTYEHELRLRDADMSSLQTIVDELKKEMLARGAVGSARLDDIDQLRRQVRQLESDNSSLRQRLELATAQTQKFQALLHRHEAHNSSGGGSSAEITIAEYEIQLSQLTTRCQIAERRASELLLERNASHHTTPRSGVGVLSPTGTSTTRR